MRQSPCCVAARNSSPTGDSVTSKRTSTRPSARAVVRKRASSSGVMFKIPPQSANTGRRRCARGFLGRAEGGTDLGVGKVIAVTQHDRRALGRRQAARQVLELAVDGAAELDGVAVDILAR